MPTQTRLTKDMSFDVIEARHHLLRAIRHFFYVRGYLEVETPYLMATAPPDPYIEPVRAFVDGKGPFFLHTSPEIGMKKLLSMGHERIFEISKVFRVEELQEVHSIEFTMLEWYRKGTYAEALEETRRLIMASLRALAIEDREKYFAPPWPVFDLGELCLEKTGMNPLVMDRASLFAALKGKGFPGIGSHEPWEDLFFKLFIQEVEPKIGCASPYFIKDWPAAVSTMAKRKDAHRVERFELYMRGIEIANGYTELLEPDEQRQRFERDNLVRQGQGKKGFPPDEEFLQGLGAIKGPRAGVSLGIDRLLMVILDKGTIEEVLPLRFTT